MRKNFGGECEHQDEGASKEVYLRHKEEMILEGRLLVKVDGEEIV